jgi:hypothetical protein
VTTPPRHAWFPRTWGALLVLVVAGAVVAGPVLASGFCSWVAFSDCFLVTCDGRDPALGTYLAGQAVALTLLPWVAVRYHQRSTPERQRRALVAYLAGGAVVTLALARVLGLGL